MQEVFLKPIVVTFANPVYGYWNGGKKSEGVFEPRCFYENDSDKSFVKWHCFYLNHWFTLPLHTKTGRKLTNSEIMARSRNHLRNSIKTLATVV